MPEPVAPEQAAAPAQTPSPAAQGEIQTLSLVSGPAAAAVTADLQALAEGLGNDPVAIFDYVRNKVRFQPYYGSCKGAHTTYLDSAGNDMDQASLLIALLNAAGYAEASYVYGKITARDTAADGNDLSRWLACPPDRVSRVLASAGYPLSGIGYGSYVAWTFDHVWVRAVVGGTAYDLDPSWKPSDLVAGVDFKTISGYARAQLIADAGGTAGADYAQNLARAPVENRLAQYAENLRAHIQANMPGSTTEDVLGGWNIREQAAAGLAGAAAALAVHSPAATTTFSSIPAQYRATLRVQIGTQIDATFNADSLQANRLSIVFAGLNAQLWLGDGMVAAETNGSGTTASVTLSVAHPYASPSQTLGTTAYARTGSYDLTYAFYPAPFSDGQIAASDARLQSYVASGLADTSRQVIAEALHGLGIKWVRRVALGAHMVGRARDCQAWTDHVIGRTGQEGAYFVDMPGCYFSVFDSQGFQPNTFKAIMFVASAMEHGVIEQNGGSAALSTIKCLALANDGGQKIFRATSSNWASVSAQLPGYTAEEKAYVGGFVNTAGNTVLLHENGRTGVNQWRGFGFASMSSNFVNMMIYGGYAGGFNSEAGWLSGAALDFFSGTFSEESFRPYGTRRALSAEPVDLATGAYTMGATDLALGEADSPRGLAFSRSYDSSRSFQSAALGNGWRHSCDGRVWPSSDLDAAFGLRQPTDAVRTIVAAMAIPDFTDATCTAKEMMVGVLSANWLVNRVTGNAANVQLGEQRLTYISRPDGSWNPPPGATTALAGSAGSFALHPRSGGSVTFDAQNRVSQWKDADGNTQTFAYDTGGRLATVTDSQARALAFAYVSPVSPLIRSVSDGTGRAVTFSYTGNNLTGVQDVEGFGTTLVYDSRNRLTDWKDHAGAYVARNTYDAQDRVIRQLSQGVANRLWKFLYSPGATREVDPLNNTTTHYFDSKNRHVGVLDALNGSSSVAYDGQNHVVKTVDATGRQTRFVYDADQNLVESTDNAGKTTRREYDAALRLRKITDPTGRATEFGYDAENHLTSIKDPGGRITSLSYNADGRLHAITTPDARTTTFTAYDQWANPVGVTRADNSTASAAFNARGDMTGFTDGRGNTTAFTYDKRRLLVTRTDPSNRVSAWTYDSNGNPATATDRNNKTTATVFDNLGRPQSVAAPDTGAVTIGYDLADRQTTVTDALNHTTTSGYDAAGRAVSSADGLSNVVAQATLDAAGRVIGQKNGLNKTTLLFYDAAGRPSYTLDPMNRRIDSTFDDAGRQATLTNRLGQTFTYGYGADGLPATFTYPSGRQSAIAGRDLAGRPQTIRKPGGQQTALTYDGMGRVKTLADAVGTITWTYDGEGNPTGVAEGGANIARTFDASGRVLTCTDISGNTVAYTYDNEGNTATITYPGNKTVSYTYDGSNRLKTVTDWAGRVTAYTYDAAGRLVQVDRPNGTRQRLEYDAADRLSASYEEKGAASLWQAGYGYDAANRLTSYTPAPPTRTYAPPAAAMTYDNDNRLASYNGQAVASDADGNLLSAPIAGGALGALAWDARNRLVGAGGITYAYDAENRRASSTRNGQTTGYTWSRGGKLDRLLVKANPDGSTTRYVHGLGLIYEETTPAGGGAAATRFYHYNWQGSTMALSDAAGNVTARLSYSPYGEVTVVSGTPNTPFLFNGQFGVMTESNGLYCLQARFYSPVFRRFLSEDPAGFTGGINLYAYTAGDPVNFMDPFGLGRQLTGMQQGLVNVLNAMAGVLSPLRLLMMDGFAERGDYQGSLAHFASLGSSSFNPARAVFNDDLSINYRGAGSVISMLAMGAVLENPSLFAARSGSTLYRAVGPAELADIKATGALRNLGSAEGKYFTTSGEAAASYAKQAVNGFGDAPYTIIQTRVPNSIFNGLSPATVDSGIPAWVIPNSRLPGLTPTVLDTMPIPR